MNAEKKLRKENNKSETSLSKSTNLILTDMIVYLHSSDLCEYDIEIIRKELIGMAEESQMRGQAFQDVVGEDYKGFCDDLIQNGRKKSKQEKFIEMAYVLIVGFGVLFIYEILSKTIIAAVKGVSSDVLKMDISLGFVISSLCALIAANLIYLVFSKYAFELSMHKKYRIGSVVLFSFLFTAMVAVRYFLNGVILCTLNWLFPMFLLICCYVMIKILDNRKSNELARTHP